jgi:DNA-binding SARP family transcriptional activator/tetratricopeptide (TPR) repeat protein
MRFSLLGPLAVSDGDEPLDIRGLMPRTVLAVLLLSAGTAVSADHLVDVLWGDDAPASSTASLRNHVMRLRRMLGDAGEDRIRTTASGYLLRVEPGELDLDAFTTLCAEGNEAGRLEQWEKSSRSLAAALALWRGTPAGDLPDISRQDPGVQRLSELRWQAWETRIDADLRLGRHDGVIGELRGLTTEHPLREAFHRQLMLALYRAGRQAEALDVFARLRRALVDELGIEPSEPLRELQLRILSADPGLRVPEPVPQGVGASRQLPADLATFTGREEVLKRLIRTAASVPGGDRANTVVVSAIEGMAGVGKTQLAIHAAHELVRAGRFADVQLYANLRGFDAGRSPADPSEVLDGFLRALGVPGSRIPAALDERAAMFRDRMHDRNAVVLLDNAADEQQIRDLIPASATCLVLITSRRTLAGLDWAAVHRLGLFDGDEAMSLLARIVGPDRVAAEPEAATRIIAGCGHLPLALALAAARLRSRPMWSLTDAADRLDHSRLDALRSGDETLRKVFGLSYRGLPDAARLTFRLIGFWPGREISVLQVAALRGVSPREAEDVLETLVDASLLQPGGRGRYQMHDLLHVFARELLAAEQEPAAARATAERVVGWYAHAALAAMDVILPRRRPLRLRPIPGGVPPLPTFDSAASAVSWCDAHRADLVTAAGLADEHHVDDIAWQLPVTLQYYFTSGLLVTEFISTHDSALRAAERSGSLEGRCRILQGLGIAYRLAGRFDEALDINVRLPQLYSEAGDRRGEATALGDLALAYKQKGEWARSVALFEEAVAALRELGDTAGTAIMVNNLGTAHQSIGDYAAAHACYQEALHLASDGGAPFAQALVRASLAELVAEGGDHGPAVTEFELAFSMFTELGQHGHAVETLENLARSQQALGRSTDAAQTLAQARNLRTTLDIPTDAALSR